MWLVPGASDIASVVAAVVVTSQEVAVGKASVVVTSLEVAQL